MRKYAAILIALTAIAVVAYSVRPAEHQDTQRSPIKIVVDQLPTSEGRIPVEIVRPAFSSSAPNRVEDVSYYIRNNTSKGINAVAVIKSITFEEGTATRTHSAYSTFDYALHPDIGGPNFLAAQSEVSMDSSVIDFGSNAMVKEIRLRIDYVLFNDNTDIGKGNEGEQKISLMREGARRYKSLVVRRYQESGKSLSGVLPLLETRDAYEELGLSDINLTMGADRYRLHLLKTFKTKGSSDVERYVKQ